MKNRIALLPYVGIGIVILLLISFSWPFSVNESGYRQHVRSFSGDECIRFEPGFYFSGFGAVVTDYPDVITVQYVEREKQAEDVTFYAQPHGVRFNDGTTAQAGHTVKWELPDDEATMKQIHKDYRSPKRLATTTLANWQKECMNYSTQIMESETHYSGGQSQLKEDFQDQLRNGQFLLDQIESFSKDSMRETEVRYIKKKRLNPDGSYARSQSDVQKYNIKPSFVSIDYFDYEDIVDEKLKSKIEAATRESISKQMLVTAQQEALTAKMEGEKMIAEKSATEEAAKIEAVIRAQKETAVAAEQAKQAKHIAAKVTAEQKAQAEANRLLVAAGLTPEQRMKMEIEIADKVSSNLAKVKFPEMMIIGGNGSSQLDPFQAVGLESFLKIQKQFSVDKK